MRTEPSSPLASAYARSRVQVGRARRWLAGRGTLTRVALLVLVLGALGGFGWFASLEDPADHALAWLFEGRKISSDQLTEIRDALDASGISYACEASPGKVGVKPERKVEALAVLAKRNLIPPTLEDLGKSDGSLDNPLLSGPADRVRHELDTQLKKLRYQVEKLDGIASADIQINRVMAPRSRLYAPPNVSAYVWLQTEGGRKLSHQAIEGIENFLTGAVPELKAESITVVDQSGQRYRSAGNPLINERIKNNGREEDWRTKIVEELRHIPDVGVSVLLEQVPAPVPPPELPPPDAEEIVRPNGPIAISNPLPLPPLPPPPPLTKARVLVRVPRSFYLDSSRWTNRHPSEEDLQVMIATTERIIRDAVEIHIPRDVLGEIKVDTVQDDLSNSRTLVIPSTTDSRKLWIWPTIYGGFTLVGVISLLATVRLATRRASPRASNSPWRPGFFADGSSGAVPGPSEKVREFVKHNPEAAAGVLQRWIGQGAAMS